MATSHLTALKICQCAIIAQLRDMLTMDSGCEIPLMLASEEETPEVSECEKFVRTTAMCPQDQKPAPIMFAPDGSESPKEE